MINQWGTCINLGSTWTVEPYPRILGMFSEIRAYQIADAKSAISLIKMETLAEITAVWDDFQKAWLDPMIQVFDFRKYAPQVPPTKELILPILEEEE